MYRDVNIRAIYQVYYHKRPLDAPRRGAEPRVERKRSTSGRATSAALRTRTQIATSHPLLAGAHVHEACLFCSAHSHNRTTTAAAGLSCPPWGRHPSVTVPLSLASFASLCATSVERKEEKREGRSETRTDARRGARGRAFGGRETKGTRDRAPPYAPRIVVGKYKTALGQGSVIYRLPRVIGRRPIDIYPPGCVAGPRGTGKCATHV